MAISSAFCWSNHNSWSQTSEFFWVSKLQHVMSQALSHKCQEWQLLSSHSEFWSDRPHHYVPVPHCPGTVTLGCAGGGDHPARVAQEGPGKGADTKGVSCSSWTIHFYPFLGSKDGTGYLFPSTDTWVTHDISGELNMGSKTQKSRVFIETKLDLVTWWLGDSKSQSEHVFLGRFWGFTYLGKKQPRLRSEPRRDSELSAGTAGQRRKAGLVFTLCHEFKKCKGTSFWPMYISWQLTRLIMIVLRLLKDWGINARSHQLRTPGCREWLGGCSGAAVHGGWNGHVTNQNRPKWWFNRPDVRYFYNRYYN